MSAPESFLLHQPSSGDVQVLRVSEDRADPIASFSLRRSTAYAGIVSPLFDPADSDSPWRKGDVLVGQTSVVARSVTRRIFRLRPILARVVWYSSEVIYEDNGSRALRSLALDPHGRLYFSEAGSPTIFRFEAVPGGVLTASAWASVPSTVGWQGDFNFAPDGPLFVSTGAGVTPGRLYKFSISGDPEPVIGNPPLQTIEWGQAYKTVHGPIEGFSFFDGDRILFASSSDAFFGDDIDASFDPKAPLGGSSVPTLPSIQIPAVRYEPSSGLALRISDLSVSRNALAKMLDETERVRRWISWVTPAGSRVKFEDWRSDPGAEDLERRLHRFYAYRVADRRPPLHYRYQIDPWTGDFRAGPETPTTHTIIRRDDAAETYLAYLAHFLWMDIKQQTPFGLGGLGESALQDLLNPSSMFNPYYGSILDDDDALARGFEYIYNREHLGPVFPSDPYRAYQFITGDPAERDDPGESFLTRGPGEPLSYFQSHRLLEWIRNYLTHYYRGEYGTSVDEWGYLGDDAPLESVYRRTSRDHPNGDRTFVYYAHLGCHTAAGLASHLMRLMLQPARVHRFYLGDHPEKTHRGLERVNDRSILLHMDLLYAEPKMDSHTGDSAAYLKNTHYQDWMAEFPTLAPTQATLASRLDKYSKIQAEIALNAFSFRLLSVLWETDLPAALNSGLRLEEASGSLTRRELMNFGLDTDAAGLLYEAHLPSLIGHIKGLIVSYGLSAYHPSAPLSERLDLLSQGLARYRSDYAKWDQASYGTP